MKPRLIVIDGKMYNSVDEMPQEVRSRYEQALRTFQDQDSNRIADVLEETLKSANANRDDNPDILDNAASVPFVGSSINVLLDGKEYNGLEDLPPEVRAKYDEAMGALDADRNGIPDFMEGMTGKKQNSDPVASLQNNYPQQVLHVPMQTSPIETPDTSNGWLLVLLGGLLVIFCAAAIFGLWYFFIR